ncbi:MAG TPA: hypothetical protein VM012_14780 [Flavitalea sp.]|nr:hypothetical protein [Flavitalea sp.]
MNRCKLFLLTVICISSTLVFSQELYVFSEPASNMPSGSLSAKYTFKWMKATHSNRIEQRHAPELMLGLNKNWMFHTGVTFSDMYTSGIRWESTWLYAKYRMLSIDDVHKHFRMALFGEYSYSRNHFFYDELSLQGDQSGVQGGIIATQLIRKIAVSSTVSYIKVIGEKPKIAPDAFPYQAFNYSLSAGALILPRNYTNYRQTNLNLYLELLGQQTLDKKRFYIDIAPAMQLIFNSNTKLNVGYRRELSGNMHRMGERGWLVSIERTFLNAIKKRVVLSSSSPNELSL